MAFLSSLRCFFFFAAKSCSRLYDWDAVRVRICTEGNTVVALFAIVKLQLFELTWRFARLCCRLLFSPRWLLRQSRIKARPTLAETVIRCYFVENIGFFITFFLVVFFFFNFMTIRSWSWRFHRYSDDRLSGDFLVQSRTSCDDAS